MNEFVQIHGRQFRFGGPGEIEDLLHDAIQMLNFFANDARILGPWIACWKLEVQRVVEHFHYRERITDLMRDLGGE